jgi:hypothetical protein
MTIRLFTAVQERDDEKKDVSRKRRKKYGFASFPTTATSNKNLSRPWTTLSADHEADGHTRSRSASSAADETSVMPTPAPSRPPATHPPCLDQQSRQWVQADAAMIDASHSDDHPAVAAAASITSSWPSTSSLQPTNAAQYAERDDAVYGLCHGTEGFIYTRANKGISAPRFIWKLHPWRKNNMCSICR